MYLFKKNLVSFKGDMNYFLFSFLLWDNEIIVPKYARYRGLNRDKYTYKRYIGLNRDKCTCERYIGLNRNKYTYKRYIGLNRDKYTCENI